MNAISRIAEPAVAQIFRVAMENIEPIWPQVEPLVSLELAGIPTHDAEDVRGMLLAGQLHLWVQWTDRIEAMAVTEFASYPRGVALRVWLGAAAADAHADAERFAVVLKQWAARNRCKWLEACGRVGWLRKFSDAKYAGVFMRLTVDWGAS